MHGFIPQDLRDLTRGLGGGRLRKGDLVQKIGEREIHNPNDTMAAFATSGLQRCVCPSRVRTNHRHYPQVVTGPGGLVTKFQDGAPREKPALDWTTGFKKPSLTK